MSLYLTASLIFFAVLFLSLAILTYARERMNPVTRRLLRLKPPSQDILLSRLTRRGEVREEEVESLLDRVRGWATLLMASITTDRSEGMTEGQRTRFSKAGIRGAERMRIYLGIRSVLMAALASMYLIYALIAGHSPLVILLMTLISLLAGRLIFRLMISSRIKRRNRMIGRNVHDAIDLLTVCLEAGLGLNIALQKVGENLRYINVALAEEFLLLNHEIQAGRTRVEAYRNMRNRTDVRELRSLLTMLIQSETLGTSLGQVLRTYSDTLRTKLRQRAEEWATKAGVKLVIPLVVFIFPPLLVVILGPTLIQVVKMLRGFAQ